MDLLKEFPSVAEDVLLIVNRRKQKYQICTQMIELQRKKNKQTISEVRGRGMERGRRTSCRTARGTT